MSEQPTVDFWATPQGVYAKTADAARGKGPYKDLIEATKAVGETVPYPFTCNFRDPAEVSESEWPITRKKKA